MKAIRWPSRDNRPPFFLALYLLLICLLATFLLVLGLPAEEASWQADLQGHVDARFILWLLAGFAAQLIDGALGMAYGVSSTAFLLSTGVHPAMASASVHLAEICTTAASGISHWRLGNVDGQLFRKLAVPGIIGAMAGALLISWVDGEILKPFLSSYLAIMGGIVLWRGLRNRIPDKRPVNLPLLGLVGGFADASGGGGWGPIVTSTLLGRGGSPRTTIGSVNAAEFLVAVAASGVFTLFIGITHWTIILGLVSGGVLAAPLGAWAARLLSHRVLLMVVGSVILFLSIRTLIQG